VKKIDKDWLDEICKMGHGAACCKYIVVDGARGICCAKSNESLKATLDSQTHMVARGDNCDGYGVKI